MSLAQDQSSENRPNEVTPFWAIVEDCLVAFHGMSKGTAHGKTNAFRKKVRNPPEGISGDIIYHEEPFYVACDIAQMVDTDEQE
jgi:hypothetical protein